MFRYSKCCQSRKYLVFNGVAQLHLMEIVNQNYANGMLGMKIPEILEGGWLILDCLFRRQTKSIGFREATLNTDSHSHRHVSQLSHSER